MDINKWIKEKLVCDEERYLHSLGTQEMAGFLAEKFNVDVEKAKLTGLLHDCAKCLDAEELLTIIDDNNLDVTDEEKNSYKTLHAPVSAFVAQKELNIQDDEILSAIRWHTIGKKNMTLLEKIVFLADKIEAKTRSEEFTKIVLNKLKETNDIDEAILICYDATIKSLVERKLFINTETIDIWNDLILKLTKKR
ncbi:MAG: bis(5'-nucleosyl)-tetraphosphatase (symmetrical) YqeK [Candidatus Gastranaerophilales bacterium]|nr:bis(5'-nucleosyl)-tetraphosphatase (symmetrical) YqeK [Candidatus Gastranaerophilales bacterium]